MHLYGSFRSFCKQKQHFSTLSLSLSLSRSPISSHFLLGSPLPPIKDTRIPQLKVPWKTDIETPENWQKSWKWEVLKPKCHTLAKKEISQIKTCNGVKRVIMFDFVEFGEYQMDFEFFSLRQPIAMVPFRSQRPLHFKVAIECYKSIINCILLHLGRELKPSSETFHKQNGFDMSCFLLCGEKSVKIIFGVKMTCQTCLYAQQVTPTSQLAFQAPLKNLRNAQQRELN